MFRIVKDDMPPLPQGLSGELNDFLQTCFRKDPASRPAATELFDHIWLKKYCPDLVSIFPSSLIVGSPYSPPYELRIPSHSSDGLVPISDDHHWTLATMIEPSNHAHNLMSNPLPLVLGSRSKSKRYLTCLAGLAKKARNCTI